MPGANTRAVAELTLLLMLATLRRLSELDRQTRAGKGWALDSELLDNLGELGGRTVGLVGFGAVGKCLTPMLHGIGAKVIYTARADAGSAATFVSLDDLLSAADIVSLHVPLTAQTASHDRRARHRKNEARRGSREHRERWARGLRCAAPCSSRAAICAAPGSMSSMPSPRTRHIRYSELPNVVVTPHVAWFTAETLSRSLGVFAENCRRLRDGEPLLNRVV